MKRFCRGGIGFLLLLCFTFQINAQSFFSAETLLNTSKYSEISTRLLDEEISRLLMAEDLSFDQWSSFFTIKTGPNNPPVLGNYAMSDGQIVFKPRFLPDAEVSYFISFSYSGLAQALRISIDRSEEYSDVISFQPPISSQPSVIEVSPDMNRYPVNLLRLYIYFSAPMGLDNPYQYIKLVDKDSREMENTFVEIPEGLWNIDRTRLTILFHPGRIKQGVGPNMIEGEIFKEGELYTLKISKDWKGASGEPLKKSYNSSFFVTKPIRETINMDKWLLSPSKGGVNQLFVKTTQPLDQALAKRMIFIQSETGQLLPSRVEFSSPREFKILWRPLNSNNYKLVVDPRLEDICGNTPHNLFDYHEDERNTSKELIVRGFTMN